jgi:hypothetical protein
LIPAIIDSHGNPGTAGTTRVLTLSDVEASVAVLVAIEVATELLVTTEVDVIT